LIFHGWKKRNPGGWPGVFSGWRRAWCAYAESPRPGRGVLIIAIIMAENGDMLGSK
jgi:hypothetical protein